MPAGDLITRVDQMEIWRSDTNRVLMGGGTDFGFDNLEGADHPAIREQDSNNPSRHGAHYGLDKFQDRQLKCELFVFGTGESLVSNIARLSKVFTPVRDDEEDAVLTWWPKDLNRKRVTGRPRRTFWTYDRQIIHGRAIPFTWRFDAPDPRWYDHTESNQALTMAVGSSAASIDIIQTGDIETEPILEITGPATNPRISNLLDGNKQVKLGPSRAGEDLILSPTDTLIVDFKKKYVTLDGENYMGFVRPDNQWWELLPGTNRLTYNRSGSTGAASFMTVKWRNAWSSIVQEILAYTPPPGGGGTYSDIY